MGGNVRGGWRVENERATGLRFTGCSQFNSHGCSATEAFSIAKNIATNAATSLHEKKDSIMHANPPSSAAQRDNGDYHDLHMHARTAYKP